MSKQRYASGGNAEHQWPEDKCPNCVTPWKCNGPHSWGWPSDHNDVTVTSASARTAAARTNPRLVSLDHHRMRPEAIEEIAAAKGIGPIKSADDLAIKGLTEEEADAFMEAMEARAASPSAALDADLIEKARDWRYSDELIGKAIRARLSEGTDR